MIYPSNFDEKTGFNQIREMLSMRCLSDMGRKHIADLHFSSEFTRINRLLIETREFLTILEMGLPFPSGDFLDLSLALNRIQTPGSWILREELVDLRKSLLTILECLHFLKLPVNQKLTLLRNKAGEVDIPSGLVPEIDKIIDEKGLIRDSASEALARIRKEIRNKANASEKIINQLLQSARKAGWTADDAEITISDGRLVIPVLASHKRKIRGLIHDESATGHTIYIEPEACFEINNSIRELENAERREINRILLHFSDFLRPQRELLLQAYEFLGEMDFIRAKAQMAKDLGANLPIMKSDPTLFWKNARHPLLFLSHQAKDKAVVPLDIALNPTCRILIITGPNAGGKSVCLKTVGLLQYMLQCGLLIPLDADSETGIFDRIFIDIGDEQSLENDLSTYSSHLLNLRYFIDNSTPSTLFLIDELGTGTDPSLGGALAEAVLEKLSNTRAMGVVTTHYSNLKLLAGKVPGIQNGSMLFDTELLQPMYRMVAGKPGSSFTFEIAQRIGFPEEVISVAKSKTGQTHLDFERQLHEVENEKIILEKRLKEFQVADQFVADLIGKYEQLKADLERSKTNIMEKAREEAKELLENSNRLIEKTIREIKESQADKGKTKAAREAITAFYEKISKSESPNPESSYSPVQEPVETGWKKGDRVSVEGREGSGIILQIKGEHAVVDFEGLKISAPLSRIHIPMEGVKNAKTAYASIINELHEKSVHFKMTLDVRGYSADEALQKVQKYIDDAYLLRIKEVSILHGKGEGILRKVIRDYLASLEEVEIYKDEHIERGGAGITRVNLK